MISDVRKISISRHSKEYSIDIDDFYSDVSYQIGDIESIRVLKELLEAILADSDKETNTEYTISTEYDEDSKSYDIGFWRWKDYNSTRIGGVENVASL